MSMLLRVDENANCEAVEGRVFSERTQPQPITAVLRTRGGQEVWCPIVAWNEATPAGSALACKVDDSGEGTCYLIYGGTSGLRLKTPDCDHSWSLHDPHQWGEPFLLLPPDGADLRFA
jgi:hypothetical protein